MPIFVPLLPQYGFDPCVLDCIRCPEFETAFYLRGGHGCVLSKGCISTARVAESNICRHDAVMGIQSLRSLFVSIPRRSACGSPRSIRPISPISTLCIRV